MEKTRQFLQQQMCSSLLTTGWLQVYTQEVHLLQILPSGRFIVLQHLGKHCWEDDNMVLSEQAHAEARWRRSQVVAKCLLSKSHSLCV